VDQNSTQIYGKDDREYPTSVCTGGISRAFCNSPVHVAVLVGRCNASTDSHCTCVDCTVPAINRIVLFSCISILCLLCTLFNHISERSIQQLNRQVSMKQFANEAVLWSSRIILKCLLPSLCQSVSAPSYASINFFRCFRKMSVVGQRLIQGDTKILRVLNVLNLRGSKLYVQCSVCVMGTYIWKTHDSVLLGFGCNRHRWKY
jgi:hypothetical protein